MSRGQVNRHVQHKRGDAEGNLADSNHTRRLQSCHGLRGEELEALTDGTAVKVKTSVDSSGDGTRRQVGKHPVVELHQGRVLKELPVEGPLVGVVLHNVRQRQELIVHVRPVVVCVPRAVSRHKRPAGDSHEREASGNHGHTSETSEVGQDLRLIDLRDEVLNSLLHATRHLPPIRLRVKELQPSPNQAAVRDKGCAQVGRKSIWRDSNLLVVPSSVLAEAALYHPPSHSALRPTQCHQSNEPTVIPLRNLLGNEQSGQTRTVNSTHEPTQHPVAPLPVEYELEIVESHALPLLPLREFLVMLELHLPFFTRLRRG
mmetsp:Transcript_22394/g.42092  ORF Transcript_22394/g.42092 Transcript_22394/m.42092 type:complete len:316 (-) Transcript_22394:500-1447(-)